MAISTATTRSDAKRAEKNIFLINFVTKHLVSVGYELKKRGYHISYWTGGKKYFRELKKDKTAFPDTVFHEEADAVQNIPADGAPVNLFDPPSRELIHDMLPYESQALIMMESIDYSGRSLSEKKHLYYEYLSYWYGVLRYYKPEALLFHDIPHVTYIFVLYHLAKKMGIKTIMHSPLRAVTDRLLFFDDYTHYSKLIDAYKKTKQENFTLEDLGSDFQDAYKTQNDPAYNPHPVYQQRNKAKVIEDSMRVFPTMAAIKKNVRDGTFLKTGIQYIRAYFNKKYILSIDRIEYGGLRLRLRYAKWRRIRKGFKKEYEALQVAPDFSKKFVYVPLHMQPERSTSAEGGVFVDQILMIAMLSYALPEDWVVYVKENESQWMLARAHLGRYSGYYKKLSALKGVYLVPATTSTFELMDKAQATATVTSTAGWEAILRGKPLLLFGSVWFMHYDDVFRVSSVDECKDALQKIKNGFVPSRQSLIAFLAALERVSTEGHYRTGLNKLKEISDEDNSKAITLGYLNELSYAD